MIVARRILGPTIGFFAVVLLALAVFFSVNFFNQTSQQENERLAQLNQALNTQLAAQADLATGLAVQIANNDNVIQALATGLNAPEASGDRQTLLATTQTQYRKLRELFDISQFQFFDSLSTVYLQVNQPEQYGQNQAAFRLTVLAANTQKRNVSGLELAPDGLNMRGVVPVLDQNRPIGAVDIGLRIDKVLISKLKSNYGADWRLLLSRQAIDIVNKLSAASPVSGQQAPAQFQPPTNSEVPDSLKDLLVLQATTLADDVYAPVTAYEQVLTTADVSSQVRLGNKSYAILSVPLRDFSGITIGVVDIIIDRTANAAALQSRLAIFVLASLIGLVVGGSGLTYITRRVLQPIRELTETASAIAQGELDRPLPDRAVFGQQVRFGRTSPDEIALLFSSFASMTGQLRGLVGRLEQRVAERTHDLEYRSLQLRVAAEVARDIIARPQATTRLAGVKESDGDTGEGGRTLYGRISDEHLGGLLSHAVELIRQRFDFYFVSIFLVDERGGVQKAILRAASGKSGRQLMEKGVQLALGTTAASGTTTLSTTAVLGIVAGAINNGEARIAQDVVNPGSPTSRDTFQTRRDQQAPFSYIPEPLLPETHSEIALPLRIGETVIGALDVQSQTTSAFHEEDVTVLQVIADQLAIAIQNAHLIEQLNQTVSELEQTSGRLTEHAWQNFLRTQSGTIGYRYNSEEGLHPIQALTTASALSTASDTTSAGSLSPQGHENGNRLIVPIRLREQTIGTLALQIEGESIPSDLEALAEEAAARLSLVLESTRLLQEAQRLAVREQLIGQVAARVRSTLDIDAVLQTAVQQISHSLHIDEVEIRLGKSE